MRKINSAVLTMQNKTRMFKEGLMEKVLTKRAGDAGTLAAIIMIVIIVGILIIIKGSLTGWVNTLTGYFDDALDNFTL